MTSANARHFKVHKASLCLFNASIVSTFFRHSVLHRLFVLMLFSAGMFWGFRIGPQIGICLIYIEGSIMMEDFEIVSIGICVSLCGGEAV